MQSRRAVESAVWGMPAVNFMAMHDAFKKSVNMEYNNVLYNSKVHNWKLQVTTPNDTTPYVMAFWNLEKDGPIVFEVPNSMGDVSLFGVVMDTWQRPLLDVGNKGTDLGRGAKYLFIPDDYEGEIPAGYVTITQKTNNAWILLRPIIKSHSKENLAKAVSFVKKIKIYPYSKAENPPKTKYIDIYDKHIDAVAHYDRRFFQLLNNVVQAEKIEKTDMAMMALLKGIGIEKNKAFKPSKKLNQILDLAGKETLEFLKHTYHNSGLLARFYGKKRQWSLLVPPSTIYTKFTFELPTYKDIDSRAALYYAIFSSGVTFNLFDPPTMYISSNKDRDGMQLSGDNNYKLTVGKNVPMKQFWSAIVYNIEDATWFDNVKKYGVASTNKKLAVNSDGTVDVYFGAKAPKGKESNWIPTPKGKEYFVYFRFYRPTLPLLTKKWVLNDIEKI